MAKLIQAVVAAVLTTVAWSQTIHGCGGITLPPPPVAQADPVDGLYAGTRVTDSYRWLEDAKSPETRAFIDAENEYTARYFRQVRMRSGVVDQLQDLESIDVWSLPIQRAGNLYFLKRATGEDQASIYIRRGWAGKDVRLLDPAVLSRDPDTSFTLEDVSRDGNLIAYGVRRGGADENEIHIFNITSGKTLEDTLPAGLYGSVSFAPEGAGFYYTRTNMQGSLLYLHVLGTRIVRDQLIFGHEFRGEPLGPIDLLRSTITDDDHYLVVTIQRGVPARRVDIVFRDLTKPGSPFEVLVWSLDARFSAIRAKGAWYIRTDYAAPNGRILRADPGVAPEAWTSIVPETSDAIEDFSIVGSTLYVTRLKDAKTETAVYTLDGKPRGALATTGIGTVSSLRGRTTDRYGFFSFQSFIQPPILYRIDTLTGHQEIFAQPKASFDSAQYEVRQVFYTSKDGTRIPMFVAGKKGLQQDGTVRLLMTGYGGFNVSMTPTWNARWAWWMEQGGWFALPNLRGGGEYGEHWHDQGMFEQKQNVFDDWFAAARFLIDEKYTAPDRFAIIGASNGGLLMGASMTQHPELFSAIVCGYPLLDMLRYQRFLQGSHSTTEYGSSDHSEQFRYLLKYSPYQNVKAHTAYPAILFFTGDSDTRVDPLHARKMTALLQTASSSGRPILLHESTGGGHSAGVSLQQRIQDDADQLAFLWTETGPAGASH
ncbi:MAG: S9 family peptidase [Acidobacteriota bacterium]|nr:S9 family peptidase [Acidobacteriota bacterium]